MRSVSVSAQSGRVYTAVPGPVQHTIVPCAHAKTRHLDDETSRIEVRRLACELVRKPERAWRRAR